MIMASFGQIAPVSGHDHGKGARSKGACLGCPPDDPAGVLLKDLWRGPRAGAPPQIGASSLRRQAGEVLPGIGGATPRRGRGAAAQLRAGAVGVDVQAGGNVPQRAVRLRNELLPRTGVAVGQDQPVAQRVRGPAAARIGHAEPGPRTLGSVLVLESTRVSAVVEDEVRRRVALGGGPPSDDRARELVLAERIEPVAEPVDLVAVLAD